MLGRVPTYRSYSIAHKNDEEHIKNGRCPSYALVWQQSENTPHWPKGHDYYLGNGKNIDDGTIHLREVLSQRLEEGFNNKYVIFCDLDGVLADFEQGVKNKFHKNIDEINIGMMWGVINKSHTFFETLPWMPKGRELWDRIQQYNPIILTGVPRNSITGAEQKIRWCHRELGPHIKVITCASKDKHKFCIANSILIDDRTDNLNSWNNHGGKFILYDEDNLDSIVERIDRHMDADLPSP
jgi:hypothetical protein